MSDVRTPHPYKPHMIYLGLCEVCHLAESSALHETRPLLPATGARRLVGEELKALKARGRFERLRDRYDR